MAHKPKAAGPLEEQAAIITATVAQSAPPTRKSQLIALLAQEGGCRLAAISDTFAWQPHTTRAAIADLRKAGHSIEAIPTDVGTGYRIRPATADECPPAANGEQS